MAKKKKTTKFSTRVSLATLSGCTQSKPAARGMIYLVKRYALRANKKGPLKAWVSSKSLSTRVTSAVTDVKLSAVFRNLSQVGRGLQGEFWAG